MIPYIIKSFRGGKSDESDKGIAGSFKHGHNLDIHSRDDTLKCGSTMATIDEGHGSGQSNVDTLITKFVGDATGSTYAFGKNGKIFSIAGDRDDPVTKLRHTGSFEIKGAERWGFSDGTEYLFWATDTSLSRKILPGDDQDTWGDEEENWKTELLIADDHHTMTQAGGVLNIGNSNDLATLDFAGSFNPAAMNLRPGHKFKALSERDDFLLIGSRRDDKAEEAHIWSWQVTADNYIQKKRVPAKSVNSIISAELLILQGGEDGEIFYSDFSDVIPLITIPGGGSTIPDGAHIDNDLAVFGISGGTYPGIWSYGRRAKNRPMALNYQYRLSPTINGSTVSSIGAVADIDGSLLVSWGCTETDGSSYGVDMVSTTTRASGLYEGLEFDGGVPFRKKEVDTIHVTMSPLPASCSIAAKFKVDKATTGGDSSANAGFKYALTGGNSTTYSTQGQVEAIFTLGIPTLVYEVGIELEPSGSSTPEILSVTSYLADNGYDHG